MSTTQVNPGAFQKRKKVTLRRFASNLKQLLSNSDYRSALNYFIAEGVNLFNERIFHRFLKARFFCPNCESKSPYFVHISNAFKISWNSACPNCNSRPRHRGLKFLYDELLNNSNAKILHFAPEPILTAGILKHTNVEYLTTDYLLEDVDLPGEDIQDLSIEDSSFDLIFCNHVIEHVHNDLMSLEEMHRILKGNGKAIITIPGDWKRRETIYFDDLRNNGHYRDYGLEVVDLMRTVFNNVMVVNMSDYEKKNIKGNILGLRELELAFVCVK